MNNKVITLPQLIPGVSAPGYGPSELCEGCGECCRALPGSYYPSDLRVISVGAIVEGIVDGRWVIDSWVGDPRSSVAIDSGGGMRHALAYFLRPRTVDEIDGDTEPYSESWGGTCANLGVDGCALSWVDRPQDCRSLRPCGHVDDDCVYPLLGKMAPKRAAALAWLPYWLILELAIDTVRCSFANKNQM